MSVNLFLRAELRELARYLGISVIPIDLNQKILDKVIKENNRLTKTYLPALNVIEILYNSEGIELEEEQVRMKIPGFLFDMNRFFQALLSRFLKENLSGYELKDEYRIKGMLSYLPGYYLKDKKRSPSIRPDFVVLENNVIKTILDAKYRDIWENGLPGDDQPRASRGDCPRGWPKVMQIL